MKFTHMALCALVSMAGFSTMADVNPVKPGSSEESVANRANNIFSVTHIKLGKYAYQIVALDSELNGDTNMTVMVMVGEGDVGGEGRI